MIKRKKVPRPPPSTSSNVANVMKANKAKDTTPELIIRQALWAQGMSGYRLRSKNLPGRPDIAYIGRRLAIFVHGCFWHRCPSCNLPLPKTNVDYWQEKFESNIERDSRKRKELEDLGWTVLEVWECQIKNHLDDVLDEIKNEFQSQ